MTEDHSAVARGDLELRKALACVGVFGSFLGEFVATEALVWILDAGRVVRG
jgi:hypothetical protein